GRGPAGRGAAGAGADAAGRSAAGAAGASGSAGSAGAAGAGAGAGLAAAGFGAGLAAGLAAAWGLATPSASSCCLRRRATGGAIDEDADFTYSPISLSFSRAMLDSMPSSAAISCTRGLATILLSGSAPGRSGRYGWRGLISSRSLLVHVQFSLFFRDWIEVRQTARVERTFLAECAPEGTFPDGGGDASGVRMDPRATPREHSRGIHRDPSVARDDPHE